MPPPLEERIAAEGPLVQVAIGLSPMQAAALRAVGLPVPQVELYTALVDTGARLTCIDQKTVVQTFGLRTTGKTRVWSAGETADRALHDIEVTMTLPRVYRIPTVVRAIALTNANLWDQGFQVLLGRDVLRYCRFHYEGPDGLFRLDF